jgi:hypothetical protein
MSIFEDTINNNPHPGSDPIARLRHTLDIYVDQPDGEWVTVATSNLYGDGEKTGLTWGDLRAIAERMGA